MLLYVYHDVPCISLYIKCVSPNSNCENILRYLNVVTFYFACAYLILRNSFVTNYKFLQF